MALLLFTNCLVRNIVLLRFFFENGIVRRLCCWLFGALRSRCGFRVGRAPLSKYQLEQLCEVVSLYNGTLVAYFFTNSVGRVHHDFCDDDVRSLFRLDDAR